MKRLSTITLAIFALLAMTILYATDASAKVYMGKITLEVGDSYTVNAVPLSSGYIATGSFSKNGNGFSFTSTGNYSCTIKALYAGTGTLSYWGVVSPPNSWSSEIWDYYWDVEVKAAPVKVTSVSLSNSTLSLNIGDSKQLSVTVYPSNATNKTVTWSSTNSSIVSVSSSGVVTANAAGSAVIICRANDGSRIEETCIVTVSDVTVSIDSKNFPDDNFRNYLLAQDYGTDGVLTGTEIREIKSMAVRNQDISSLQGIEYFSALNFLYCEGNQLTSLDVSKNTALTNLNCQKNQLTSLNVSNNSALKSLYCGRNQLTSLDVSKNAVLATLSCSDNQLTSLDVSKNTALETLYCYDNQLTSLDVSKNTALGTLWCHNNQLTTLDVSKNTALTSLNCSDNQLTSLDVSNNTALKELTCSDNQLTSLDISKNTALGTFWCFDNQLTSLDVSNNTALIKLFCYNNKLTTLDVSNNKALTELRCSINIIKGEAMDALINSLPQNTTGDKYRFYIVDPTNENEGNVCTKTQVEAAKAKGWFPSYYDKTLNELVEYEGSEDTSIATSISLPITETVEIGQTIQLTPTINPAEAEATLTWTTDDATIAKVTSMGIVLGIKEGTAIITVTTDNGLKAECFVMVQNATGISTVCADGEAEPVYSLSGQRHAAPRKGLNIIGGKKVVIK